MTYRGHIQNGEVKWDDEVRPADGATVRVEVVDDPADASTELSKLMLRHAGKGENLPPDLASNHDYYAHGKPKP